MSVIFKYLIRGQWNVHLNESELVFVGWGVDGWGGCVDGWGEFVDGWGGGGVADGSVSEFTVDVLTIYSRYNMIFYQYSCHFCLRT